MFRDIVMLCLLLGLLPTPPLPAQSCQLCRQEASIPDRSEARRPLRVEIESALDFSSLVDMSGRGGTAEVDSRSGTRRLSGGMLGLGGAVLRGSVRISGEPFARVVIRMPSTLELRASGGGSSVISQIETDLPADPALDATGKLSFSFGGRMRVNEGASGDFQGRFPVFVDYQ